MLNSPAITELTTEDAPLNLVGEWLRQWFNGALNQVGANAPVLFPVVNVAFNQSPNAQPVYQFIAGVDTTIRLVMLPRTETAEHLDNILAVGKLATARVLFNFYIQAKHPVPGQSQEAAQNVAKLLKAILTNPLCVADLVNAGVRMTAPEPPRPITSGDYAQRLVACGAQLTYAIRFGDQPVAPDGSTVPNFLLGSISASFYQPNDLIQGEFLLNSYQWTGAVTILAIEATALAPQVSPVVLVLVVNGVPTSTTLTLPVAGALATVDTGLVPVQVTVPAGQKVQWQVLSAPSPVNSAWQASVTMRVVPG